MTEATVFRIVRLNYSVCPWRIVDQNDQPLSHLQPYPSSAPSAEYMGPIQMDYAFATRGDAVNALGELAGRFYDAAKKAAANA
jgi:hypothetical protein